MKSNNLILLIRHGPVAVDPLRPSHDWTLTSTGRSACKLFAQKIRNYNLSSLITSQEQKAVETGQILASSLNLPLRSLPNLEEQRRSSAPFFSNPSDFKDAIEQIFDSPGKLVYGEETADDALARFSSAVNHFLEQQLRSNIGFVTHGTVMTLFI